MLPEEPVLTSINKRLFSENKRIEIVIDNAVKYNAVIKTRIKNSIVISMQGKQPKSGINKGDILKFFLESNNSQALDSDSDFYSCYSIVAGVMHNNSTTHIGIKYPERVEKLGIRKFFRMPINLQIFYRPFYTKDPYNKVEDIPERFFLEMRSTHSTDISGSGIKIILHESCKKGQDIIMLIPALNNMKILGKVEWIHPTELMYSTQVALSYKSINNKDQDKIITFIFSTLRKNRSRTK
jgi:hypothetical protein